MAKDKLTDYSATNASNTDVGGVNINEGMLPSDVNNAIREVMTHLKDFAEGTEAVNSIAVGNITVGGTVTADGIDVQGDGTISGGSRLTISDIADVNNDGIRLDDSTTGRFNNLTQDSSGNFKIQHWTGSAWQNNLTVTTGGSVGIGTATPAFSRTGGGLRIDNGNAPVIRLDNGSSNVSEIYQSGVNTVIDSRSPSGVIKFTVQDSEKMRLDSGNLLVGGTNTFPAGNNVVGTAIRPDGDISITKAGDFAIFANRKDSDGGIIDLRKDGSTVGTIGTQNWGIGTASPAKPLTVVGGDFSTVLLDNANASHGTQILFQANGATNSGADIQMSDAGGMKIRTLAVEPLSFHTSASAGSPSEHMRLTSAGRLGIGTSSPTQEIHGYSSGGDFSLKLESASATGTAYTMYKNADQEYAVGLRGSASDTFQIIDFTADATRLTVDTSGNVGIGTASPSTTLHAKGATASGVIRAEHNSSGVYAEITGSSSNAFVATGNNPLIFEVNSGERARFDASGNFMVGKTSGNIATAGIELRANDDVLITKDGNTSLYLNRLSSNGTTIEFHRSSSNIGNVSVSTVGVTYNTTSDIRLKQDIEPLEATDKLMAMNPVSYNWKADPDGPRSMGFIAQEMQEVMPEAVSTGDDDMMSMDYGRITPILVSALQDAHRKIDELAAEIAELKAN